MCGRGRILLEWSSAVNTGTESGSEWTSSEVDRAAAGMPREERVFRLVIFAVTLK